MISYDFILLRYYSVQQRCILLSYVPLEKRKKHTQQRQIQGYIRSTRRYTATMRKLRAIPWVCQLVTLHKRICQNCGTRTGHHIQQYFGVYIILGVLRTSYVGVMDLHLQLGLDRSLWERRERKSVVPIHRSCGSLYTGQTGSKVVPETSFLLPITSYEVYSPCTCIDTWYCTNSKCMLESSGGENLHCFSKI